MGVGGELPLVEEALNGLEIERRTVANSSPTGDRDLCALEIAFSAQFEKSLWQIAAREEKFRHRSDRPQVFSKFLNFNAYFFQLFHLTGAESSKHHGFFHGDELPSETNLFVKDTLMGDVLFN